MNVHNIVAKLVHSIQAFDFHKLFIPAWLLTFLAVALATFLMTNARGEEKLTLMGFARHCFPPKKWRWGDIKVDVAFYFISKFTTNKAISIISTVVIVYFSSVAATALISFSHSGLNLHSGPVELVVISIVLFVFGDLGIFLSHLIQHKVKFLWEFHRVHHSSIFMNPITTYRFHPVDDLLNGLLIGACQAIPIGLAKYLFGLSFVELFILNDISAFLFPLALISMLVHSHFPISFGPLDKIFISPRTHQIHHSVNRAHFGKNLGTHLSIWDRMIGTLVLVPKEETIVFGMGTIEDERGDFSSIFWCYFSPFINLYKKARKSWVSPAGSPSAARTAPNLPGVSNDQGHVYGPGSSAAAAS